MESREIVKKISKILLVVPPNICLKGTMPRVGEPLGLLSIATYLESKGLHVQIYDMSIEGYENEVHKDNFITYGDDSHKILDKLRDFKPDMVGVSVIYSFKEKAALEICRLIKEYDKTITTTVGGMPPSFEPDKYVHSNVVDYVIISDGEVRLAKLIDNLNNCRSPDHELDGLAFLGPDRAYRYVQPIEINQHLQSLPYPKRKFIDMEKLIRLGLPFAPFNEGRRTAHLIATKGCPGKCTFCAINNFVGKKIRYRAIDNIMAEIDELVQVYKIEEIQFMDENLTLNKDFAAELFRALGKYRIKWCTPSGLYFNSIDEKLLDLMAESGCYQITLAIESGSPRVLQDIIHKNVRLDKVKTIVDRAHALNMFVHGFFMVGFPGETLEEIHQTLKFPFDNNFDSVSLSLLQIIKGAELYDTIMKKGYRLAEQNVTSFSYTNLIIPPDADEFVISPENLAELVDETLVKFYEHSKARFPDIWKKKYPYFLEKAHVQEENLKHKI